MFNWIMSVLSDAFKAMDEFGREHWGFVLTCLFALWLIDRLIRGVRKDINWIRNRTSSSDDQPDEPVAPGGKRAFGNVGMFSLTEESLLRLRQQMGGTVPQQGRGLQVLDGVDPVASFSLPMKDSEFDRVVGGNKYEDRVVLNEEEIRRIREEWPPNNEY